MKTNVNNNVNVTTNNNVTNQAHGTRDAVVSYKYGRGTYQVTTDADGVGVAVSFHDTEITTTPRGEQILNKFNADNAAAVPGNVTATVGTADAATDGTPGNTDNTADGGALVCVSYQEHESTNIFTDAAYLDVTTSRGVFRVINGRVAKYDGENLADVTDTADARTVLAWVMAQFGETPTTDATAADNTAAAVPGDTDTARRVDGFIGADGAIYGTADAARAADGNATPGNTAAPGTPTTDAAADGNATADAAARWNTAKNAKFEHTTRNVRNLAKRMKSAPGVAKIIANELLAADANGHRYESEIFETLAVSYLADVYGEKPAPGEKKTDTAYINRINSAARVEYLKRIQRATADVDGEMMAIYDALKSKTKIWNVLRAFHLSYIDTDGKLILAKREICGYLKSNLDADEQKVMAEKETWCESDVTDADGVTRRYYIKKRSRLALEQNQRATRRQRRETFGNTAVLPTVWRNDNGDLTTLSERKIFDVTAVLPILARGVYVSHHADADLDALLHDFTAYDFAATTLEQYDADAARRDAAKKRQADADANAANNAAAVPGDTNAATDGNANTTPTDTANNNGGAFAKFLGRWRGIAAMF